MDRLPGGLCQMDWIVWVAIAAWFALLAWMTLPDVIQQYENANDKPRFIRWAVVIVVIVAWAGCQSGVDDCETTRYHDGC